jgi:hypothetical protein
MRSLIKYVPAFKLPLWMIVAVFLVVGWRHRNDQNWIGLALLTAIDIFSAVMIARDRRRGAPRGNPNHEIARQVREQIRDGIVGEALQRIGLPERYVEGYQLAQEGRHGPPELGLGSRVFFNHLWTVILLGLCVYIVFHGWR